jgi:glycosyltransferase involved in cell wall biosynthesis
VRREAVSYADLPAALADASAAILPYVGGDFGRRISPLKAREALAAGLPLVATDVPELRTLGRAVHLGRDAAALAASLEAALAAGPGALPSPEDLAGESWEARAEALSEMLLAASGAAGAPGGRAGRVPAAIEASA